MKIEIYSTEPKELIYEETNNKLGSINEIKNTLMDCLIKLNKNNFKDCIVRIDCSNKESE